MEPGEVGVEAAALSVVIDDDVFTHGERLGVEMLNCDAIVGGFVPGVNDWLCIGHC